MKVCSGKCGTLKPLTEFRIRSDGKSKDGYHHICKLCHSEMTSKWKLKNRDKMLQTQQKYNTKYREEINMYSHLRDLMNKDGKL